MNNKIQKIGSNPTGLKGRFAGIIMNLINSGKYKKIIKKYIIKNIDTKNDISILDVGCGGGKVINIFSSIAKNSKIYGIDHSIDMVRLSKKVNKAGITGGKVDIVQGNVYKLPYKDSFFNIITAFDTISFWNDLDVSINEIKRVLKKDGLLFIVNGYPKAGTKWYNIVKFKNDNEYRSFLIKCGLREINIMIEKNTIMIKALK